MQDNEKKPALRFKGFTDPWEQRKLGDAFERVVRKNTNNESRLPLTISAQDGLVDQITYFNNRVASRDVSNYYLVYNGEFAYNKSTSDGYPFGAVKRLDWYEKGVLSTLYIVFALKHPEKDDSDFMTVFYDTDRWHRGVAERAAEGARNHGLLNISADDFFDIDTTMPEDKVEQEKIGRLLKKLDTLITLHQRKYEKLVNIKKSMLDKMFPQNGASVPEIRFKGFTDPWEQRKFGEVVDKYEDPVETPHDGYYRLGIRSHAKGTFHSYVEKGHELETAQMYRVAAGNFIVNITFGWEHAVAITNESDAGKLVSHRFPQYSFHDDMLPEFFKYVIADEDFRHWLWLASPGGAGRNRVLKLDEMLNYEMVLPSKEEQQRIAAIFRNLDTLITLHQREHIKPILEVKRVKRNE